MKDFSHFKEHECMVDGRLSPSREPIMELTQKRNFRNGNPEFREDGKPVMVMSFLLLVNKESLKTHPVNKHFWETYWRVVMKGEGISNPNELDRNNFSTKYIDCDTHVNKQGLKESDKEGRAGHLRFSLGRYGMLPQYYKYVSGQNVPLESNELKFGDYVRVLLSLKHNKEGNQSIFINPEIVFLTASGKPLGGPSVESMGSMDDLWLPPDADIGGLPEGDPAQDPPMETPSFDASEAVPF